MKALSSISLSLGILLMAAAFIYPRTVDPKTLWSEEQARQHTEIGVKVHDLVCSCNKDATTGDQTHQCEELMERYNQSQAELDEARQKPHRVAAILRWLGIGCTILGAVVYYSTRSGT